MITRFSISKLYGHKNIDISFSKDITLLVGKNGSGKTTVLNIISSIGAGNIDFLIKYDFYELQILYVYQEENRRLNIKRVDNDTYLLNWRNISYEFSIDIIKNYYNRRNIDREGKIEEYEIILKEISKELNLLYLPLSRNMHNTSPVAAKEKYGYRDIYIIREEYNSISEDSRPVGSIDESLEYVNRIVKENHRKMMIQYELLNEKMRKRMFQTFFTYDNKLDMNVITDEDSLSDNRIQELKNAFREMDLLSIKFEKEIDEFFDRLRKGRDAFSQWTSSGKGINHEVMAFMSNISQVDRILRWQKIVQNINSQKAAAQKPMKTFLDTVNSFLKESDKEIEFNEKDGKLTFCNKYNQKNISLDKMSSGEKQIVIFFAYLVFKINDNSNGIFIIDEPELSLHLSWQRRFIKSILKAAPNLQLIFATHSPEIIGPFKENCVVLGGGYQ